MKKIGNYTMRGQLDPSTLNKRIHLFDGRFDTAYRIVKFEVTTNLPSNSTSDASLIVTTEPNISTNAWDWDDNTQIAWGAFITQGTDTGSFPLSYVDPDNLIVEDLFISAFVADNRKGNYMIHLEKYEISEGQGALTMVRNKSQGAN